MALILCTSVPLAAVAGILAWHTYLTAAENSFSRSQTDADMARREIIRDVERTRNALETLSDIGLNEDGAAHAFELVQSVSDKRYCSLVLIDRSHHIVAALRDMQDELIECEHSHLPISDALDAAGSLAPGQKSRTEVMFREGKPFVRFILSVLYRNGAGIETPGILVAFKPPIDPKRMDRDTTMRASPDEEDISPTDLWLYAPQTTPVPLSGTPRIETPWDPNILARLDRDASRTSANDRFSVNETYFAITPGFGAVSIVAVTERSSAEAHALHLFMARVMLIVLLLIIELLLVALAAQRYLVAPLERLASSVAEWRRYGTFQPDLPNALPREIRHLERAFKRATRRLDRHETRLKRAAKQQDLLIREIHHRVKNNLQIVASLLNLQANRIKSVEAKEEFRLIRDRVRSLATLHRHLYPESGLTTLDIRAFLEELTSQIFMANNSINKRRISLSLSIENVPIMPDQAVPLSLIVTEIVTNALRYAFPNIRAGRVGIRLFAEDKTAILLIEDDGVGLSSSPEEYLDKREGIGLQLVRGFARQLGGKLSIASDHGTSYRLEFPIQKVRRTLAFSGDKPSPEDKRSARF